MFYRRDDGELHNGESCPKCCSEEIEVHDDAFPKASQYLLYTRCCNCDYKWTDVYELKGYEEGN